MTVYCMLWITVSVVSYSVAITQINVVWHHYHADDVLFISDYIKVNYLEKKFYFNSQFFFFFFCTGFLLIQEMVNGAEGKHL